MPCSLILLIFFILQTESERMQGNFGAMVMPLFEGNYRACVQYLALPGVHRAGLGAWEGNCMAPITRYVVIRSTKIMCKKQHMRQ